MMSLPSSFGSSTSLSLSPFCFSFTLIEVIKKKNQVKRCSILFLFFVEIKLVFVS